MYVQDFLELASSGSTGNNTHSSLQVNDGFNSASIEFVVTSVGATPTVTWKVQGSVDGATWYDVRYITDAGVVSTAPLTATAVGRQIIFSTLPYTFYRLVTSANTNVAYTANIRLHNTPSMGGYSADGVYRTIPPTLADGQRGDLQLDTRGSQLVAIKAFGAASTGSGTLVVSSPTDNESQSDQGHAYVSARPSLFNGSTWDRLRTPIVFKDVAANVTAGTPVTVWTPAAGKKFRLMGWVIGSSSSVAVLFKESGSTLWRTVVGGSFGTPSPPMGNGYLAAAANNVLQVDVTTGGPLTISGVVFGTEE